MMIAVMESKMFQWVDSQILNLEEEELILNKMIQAQFQGEMEHKSMMCPKSHKMNLLELLMRGSILTREKMNNSNASANLNCCH